MGCSNLTAGGHDVLSVELTKRTDLATSSSLLPDVLQAESKTADSWSSPQRKYAGPKLRAVCEKLNIPPVLNFGPCLAIGRLEIVATEIAARNWRRSSTASTGAFCRTVAGRAGIGRRMLRSGSGLAASSWTSAICNRKQAGDQRF